MALIRTGGAGSGQQKPEKPRKKKREKEKILARKSRIPTYPPQKQAVVPRSERGRPKEDRNIPDYLRPTPEESLPYGGGTGASRYDPRIAGTTEGTVRDITDPYFAANHALPDYVAVAQLMQDPKYAPRSEEQKQALWEPIMDAIDPELPYLMAGDFFNIDNGRDSANKIAAAMGIKPAARALDTINAPMSDKVQQPDWKLVNEQLELVRNNKRSRYPDMSDFLIGQSELGKLYAAYYDRLVERDQKPGFARDSTEYSPSADYTFRMGIFGRQLPWALYPTKDPKAVVTANEIIRKIRQGGFGQDYLQRMAQVLDVSGEQTMGNFDTAAGVISALKVADSELIREVVYDGWEFGRPVGQTKAQARKEFVATFGMNRLPGSQAALYQNENKGIFRVLEEAGELGRDVTATINRIPYLRDTFAPVGAVISNIDKITYYPIQVIMQAATAGGIHEVLAGYKDWDWETYNLELAAHGGESGMDKAHPEARQKYDFGRLFDLGSWASAWEAAEGKTPLANAASLWDMTSDGSLGATSGQVGQLADFAVIMYIGGKMDALTWGSRIRVAPGVYVKEPGLVQYGAKASWDMARASHKLGWRVYNIEKKILQSGGNLPFVFISSRTPKGTKEFLKGTGQKDPGLPPPVHGLASLRTAKGEGIAVRVVTENGPSDAKRLHESLNENVKVGKVDRELDIEPSGPEDILDTGRADLAAREGDVLSTGVGGAVVRVLTPNEFKLTNPPIPGLTYRGGKPTYNPRTSRHTMYAEGRGPYVTDNVYIAPEYATGQTGWAGKVQYVDGKPRNPIDFDKPADEEFWRDIFDKIFQKDDDFGHWTPEVDTAPTPGGHTDLSNKFFDKMKEDLDWDAGAADPNYQRDTWEHMGGMAQATGHVQSGEVFRWVFRHTAELAAEDPRMAAGLMDIHDALQKNIVRRGYDAQIHTEGLRRGDPHRVTVWFEEAVKGEFAKSHYDPDPLLELRGRRRLVEDVVTSLEAETPALTDITDLPTQLGNRVMEADEAYVASNFDEAVRASQIDEIIADETLWTKLTYKGADVQEGELTFMEGLHHKFERNDGVNMKFAALGQEIDLDGIPGALKNRSEIKILSDDEAYERYLQAAEDALISHDADPTSPIRANTHNVKGHAGAVNIDLLAGGFILVTSHLPGKRPKVHMQSYVPPKWLSTNAELLTRVDNPYTIVKMYGITNDSQEVKDLLKKIARETDQGIIETDLRHLEQHGINIDAGSSAAIRAARLKLMEKGVGDIGWSRVFTTMTTYGRSQPLEHAADSIENIGSAVKLGGNMNKKETLGHLRRLAEKAWEADDANTQKVVDEMWDLVDKNLGVKGIEDYKAFERKVYWARGQKYISHLRNRAYYGGSKDGVDGVELSLVANPKLREILPQEHAHALDKFNEVHSKETKRLEARVKFLENEMVKRHGSAAPRKGSTLSGDLTRTKQELDDINRLVSGALHPDVVQARHDIAALAGKLGANEKELTKLAEAVNVASIRTQKYADAMAVFERLGGKRRLRQTVKKGEKISEQEEWDNAMKALDEFRVVQPFKMGQTRKHIIHRYDPRIMGWYMSGSTVQNFMLLDQAVFEPLIRIFKETVMATMGFPVRVNVGDELVRLIPEGVFQRYYQNPDRRNIRQTVIDELGNEHAFDDFDSQLTQALAADFDTNGNPDDWTMILPNEPTYFRHLSNDLKSWAEEPIVIRLINSNIGGKGQFPTDVSKIKAFIRKLRDEKKRDADGKIMYDADGNAMLTSDALAIRAHLNDTNRSDVAWKTRNGKKVKEDVFDTPMFEEWLNGWEDRLTVIAENEPLRRAMTGKVEIDELTRWGNANRHKLWPVNAPNSPGVRIHSKNPLYLASYLNPFHYAYSNKAFGTQKVMGIIGNKVKTALFNDRYYTLRNEILYRHPDIDKNELHRMVSEAALKHADQASYSRSTTMFEDMSRNILPFISAYRQFWLYWGKLSLTHPFSMAAVRQAYPDLFNDPFRFAGDDYQFLIPQIPFWGPQPEEGDKGMWGLVKGQMPSYSFLGVLPTRMGLALSGQDPEKYAEYPMMGSLAKSFAPYKRIANLTYGLGLTGAPPDSLEWLFGDGDKMEKAHINAVLSWMRYGATPTGAELQMEVPIWAQLINMLPGTQRPEAVWGEFIKTNMPIGTYYSPEEVRNRQNWIAEYGALKTEQAKAMYRMNNKWIDTYLDYYEADAEGQVAMKLDPKNAQHLKWWASPYDYSLVGDIIDPADWQNNMLDTGRERKDEEHLKRYIHNLYTDIYGGVYLKLDTQDAGVEYQGDIAKKKAIDHLEKQAKHALQWAKDIAHAYALKYGWDEKQLMYDFEHPGGIKENGDRIGWGVWNTIIKEKGLNPYEYDLRGMNKLFNENWNDKSLKTTAYNASSEDLLKAFNLTEWMVNPKLAKDFRESSGDVAKVATTKKELKIAITKEMSKIASDQWYYIKADQLDVIGIKADPRIDVVQLNLKKSWLKWHTYKAGTDEYKAARNAYYEEQRKTLGKLEGGMALVGGLADRLEHIPYFTKPNLISVGSGRQAARQAAAWDDYVKVRNQELAKKDPDKAKIDKAWEAFAGVSNDKGSGGIERKMLEKGRVRLWHSLLEEADRIRKILVDSDSDYYEAKGNSVSSKFGKKWVADIQKTIDNFCKANPLFKQDVETYFGEPDYLGTHLIDWYNY